MLPCDSGGESQRREWEGKIKLVLLLTTPLLVASRAEVEPHAEAKADSKQLISYSWEC